MHEVDELIINSYRHVVESGDWDIEWLRKKTGARVEQLNEVRRSLVALQVIERDADGRSGWRAVSPRVAMAKLVTPIEVEARGRAAQAEALRSRLQMLLPVHEAKQQSESVNAIEVLTDSSAIAMMIAEEAAACSSDLVTLGSASAVTEAAKQGLDARGGVRVRAVFPHSARYEPVLEAASACHEQGVEFRTTHEVPIGMIGFDRRACMLVHAGSEALADGSAVVIRNPLVVSLMSALFEEVWHRSHPLRFEDPQPSEVEGELQLAILRLLASGAKDELVARRLDMSVRTCRRRISALMVTLEVKSRFQLGREVARRELI
ncbi:hypothetical protein [Catellatospora methionotrophica]|uniref:hypothetical protein n=1 Tax=Catellatospora methionotrophica TaxID=121620 RepID=UPI0033EBD8C5